MSSIDLQQVKKELVEAGLEIYRTKPSEIEIAERVRLHIMDSGVRVRSDLTIVFTARSQRSDFPSVAADLHFEKVRTSVGQHAIDRGYREETAQTIDVRDPMDDAKVLDVWHEVIYAKDAGELAVVVEEVQWVLGIDRCVTPDASAP